MFVCSRQTGWRKKRLAYLREKSVFAKIKRIVFLRENRVAKIKRLVFLREKSGFAKIKRIAFLYEKNRNRLLKKETRVKIRFQTIDKIEL